MFESVQADETAARFRAAGLPPLGAGIIALSYVTVYPLLPRVPALLFWSVDAILLIGTAWGVARIARALQHERPRGAIAGWAAGAIGVEVLCAWLFLSFTFPWL